MTHEPLSIKETCEYNNMITIRVSDKQFAQLNDTACMLDCNISQVLRAIINNYYNQ